MHSEKPLYGVAFHFFSKTMIKAILIDFDDTLCPTEVAGFTFENEILRQMGRHPQSRAYHRQTWGQPLFEIIKSRSPGINVEKFRELARDLWPQWVSLGKMDYIPAENLMILDAFRKEAKHVLIVTSRMRDEVNHLLDTNHVLASRLDGFYYHEVLDYHKPDPRTFDKVLRAHNLLPSECVYVGDTPGDAAAATQAGLYFIANLESGIRRKHTFNEWRVDAFMSSFTELGAAVHGLERVMSHHDTTPILVNV